MDVSVLDVLVRGLLMGVTGAALMDVWALVLRRGFGVQTLDYALLGRWIAHMPRGRFLHERIAVVPTVPGERWIGWLAHFTIGVSFAVLLLIVAGADWAQHPTLLPALAIALATILAPWLVMQPAMGAGVAGSRTPNPRATRIRNLGSHAMYGLGLYVTAVVLATM
jgi:hypothetical protein